MFSVSVETASFKKDSFKFVYENDYLLNYPKPS